MEISSSIKCNDTLVFSCQMWGVSYMHLKKSSNVYYRPQRSCGQGNVFTGVCLSTGGWGEGVCLSACWDANPPGPGRPPPWTRQTPSPPDQADPPRTRQTTPPGTRQTPPRDQADPQTRQTPPDQADPPRTRQTTPPWDQADTPPGPGRHPPRTRQTPPPGPGRHPPGEADSSIRSTSGQYASYWNAFLLLE